MLQRCYKRCELSLSHGFGKSLEAYAFIVLSFSLSLPDPLADAGSAGNAPDRLSPLRKLLKLEKQMKKIGLLSDTHGYWDERYLKYFEPCDEIWHAGDIGSLELAGRLAAFRPLRAVYGNIDGLDIRQTYPQVQRFTLEGTDVLMKHIGGYPGKYDPSVRGMLKARPPRLFISGHSHILKVKYDPAFGLLHINPGAAGLSGFHKVRTLVRFEIGQGQFRNLEVIELGNRGQEEPGAE